MSLAKKRSTYVDRIREYFKRTPIVNIKSIAPLVRSQNYAYVIINYLLKRGEIQRITKGYYTVHDEPSLIVNCLKPAYLGLQDAMSFHNLWEQETNPVIVTTRKVRCGLRSVLGNNVIIRRISPKYFFGFDYYKYGDFLLPISDVEKTFIDMVYFNEINELRKEVIKKFKRAVDHKKLNSYLKKYPKRFREKAVKLLK